MSDTGSLLWGLHTIFPSPGWPAPNFSASLHRGGAAVLYINIVSLLRACSNSSISLFCLGPQSWGLQREGEEKNHLLQPAGHTALDTAQDSILLLKLTSLQIGFFFFVPSSLVLFKSLPERLDQLFITFIIRLFSLDSIQIVIKVNNKFCSYLVLQYKWSYILFCTVLSFVKYFGDHPCRSENFLLVSNQNNIYTASFSPV